MTDNNQDLNVHFKISAAVVKQLGEELITDEVTAFMELVKNSYDADSTRVTIDINTTDSSTNQYLLDPSVIAIQTAGGEKNDINDRLKNFVEDSSETGYISIKDNGFGMSQNEIIEKWMTISLSEKRNSVKNGIQTDKGRSYLGEKGVGRLSTQRLGSIIDLITGKSGDSFYTHLYFDWSAFSEDVTLDSIKPGLKQIAKPKSESGTELIIRKLKSKEIWEGESYSKILGQLSQLISPKYNTPGGFKINIKKNNAPQDLLDINKIIDQSFVSSFSLDVREDILSLEGVVSIKKLYGSTKENHKNFERFIVPDNGKDFIKFLTNSAKNKKEYISQITYKGESGILFSWKLEINIKEIPELVYVEQRDHEDNLILDNDGLLIYELAHPGPFSGRINDYSFSKDFGQVLDNAADIKTIIQNQTGIRIYRDGFGIKPYGINSQDWLKLGAGNTSGASFYGLKPFNVVGYIEIGAKENYLLKEKTDREGFIDSPHSLNFFKIMDFIVKQINSTLEKTRRSFNEYIKSASSQNIGIDPIQDTFKNLTATAETSRVIEQRMTSINFRLSETKSKMKNVNLHEKGALEQQLGLLNAVLEDSDYLVNEISSILNETKKLDEYVGVLKPQIESLESQLTDFTELASLGLTAEALSHELSNIADKLYDETNSIIKKYAKKIPSELIRINVYLESVKSSVSAFRKQLSHLDPSLKYVRDTKKTYLLTDVFVELESYYKERFSNIIDLEIKNEDRGSKITVNKGKLFQIIDNIVLNSEYWLKEKLKGDRSFTPKIVIQIAPPYIRISDNGNGIPKSIEETLFQPFVTLKPKGLGRGLGLFIVQQLLDSIGCSISLLPERNQSGNKYIFQLYINSLISM